MTFVIDVIFSCVVEALRKVAALWRSVTGGLDVYVCEWDANGALEVIKADFVDDDGRSGIEGDYDVPLFFFRSI